jgi:predicted hotdog family 3-hydroxylacyl-ACP dehydratase
MPTYERDPRFIQDLRRLSRQDYARFRAAVMRFAAALDRGGPLPAWFGVQVMAGYPRIYEFHWAPNGQATFEFRAEVVPGKRHVYWRRVGGHEIYGDP